MEIKNSGMCVFLILIYMIKDLGYFSHFRLPKSIIRK